MVLAKEQIGHRKRTESTESLGKDIHKYSQVISDKGAKGIQRKKGQPFQ